MELNNLNWNDLKYVLAVAEAGSVNSAARRIGVNHATVLRRIAQLETDLGHQVFERDASGYRPSRQGERAVATAARVRAELQSLDRQLNAPSSDLDGEIRVTTTDSLLNTVVGPALRTFQVDYPQIKVDLIITNRLLSLNRRHADIAIRPTRQVPEGMNAIRVCPVGFALYASQEYLAGDPNAPQIESRWLSLNPGENTAPTQYWMQSHYPNAFVGISADSYVALAKLTEQHHGLAVLPCCLGESSNGLIRLGEPLIEIETTLWIMTPGDLAGAARIEAFCQHMSTALQADAAVISGARNS